MNRVEILEKPVPFFDISGNILPDAAFISFFVCHGDYGVE